MYETVNNRNILATYMLNKEEGARPARVILAGKQAFSTINDFVVAIQCYNEHDNTWDSCWAYPKKYTNIDDAKIHFSMTAGF